MTRVGPGVRVVMLSPAFLALALGPLACARGVQPQEYQILRTLPHDPGAYTQGLVFHDGYLYESTGRLGTSGVRKVDPATGEILAETALSDEHFGEGLARVGSELYQLTWHAGLAFVYDLETLTVTRSYSYEGEGWGLCFDGESLFMSDGTDRLVRRDPATFEVLEELQVTKDGISVWRVNELECVGEDIFANVYPTTRILRLDKTTGRVRSELDGYQLSVLAGRASDPEAVLNGVAHDPDRGTFLVTGKLWDSLFEVRLEGG